MKKRTSILIMLGLALSIMLPLISAQWYGYIDLRQGSDQVIQWVKDFSTPFFEILIGDYSGGDFFFAKVLMLLLLFTMIYYILKKSKFLSLEDNNAVLVIISSIVSILAIRFIPENDFVDLILLPYNTLGIALLSILPFFLFFFFLHKTEMGSIGRRIGWSFYAVIFGVLWYNRYYSLSSIGNQIYGWTLAVIILALLFDGQIHEYFGVSELKEAEKKRLLIRQGNMLEQAEKIEKIGTSDSKKIADKLKKDAEEIGRKIARL